MRFSKHGGPNLQNSGVLLKAGSVSIATNHPTRGDVAAAEVPSGPLAEHPNSRQPAFLVSLGLSFPCSVADVEHAVAEKAREAHPEQGGSLAAYRRLRKDFEQALDYVRFHPSGMDWLAARVEGYVRQTELVAAIGCRDGWVDIEPAEWFVAEVGEDFAHLLERLVGIHLTGPDVDDETVHWLNGWEETLAHVRTLDLSDSQVTLTGLGDYRGLATLRQLDLRGTAIDAGIVRLLPQTPHLQWLGLSAEHCSWRLASQLKWRFPGMKVVAD